MPSYEHRGKSWSVVFLTWEDGHKIKKRLSNGYKTKREAVQGYEDYLKNKDNLKRANDPMNMTLESLYFEYYKHQTQRVKASTLYDTKHKIEDKILPVLGDLKMGEITVHSVEDLMDSMQGYSHQYKTDIFRYLIRLLRYFEDTYDRKTCANKLKPPKDNGVPREMQIWTREQYELFRSKVDDAEYRAFFDILYYTGCRRGEALALSPKDIDYRANTIYICKSVGTRGKEVTSPKNKYSIRKVTIPSFVAEELSQLDPSGCFLFGKDKPLPNETIRRVMDKAIAQARLPRIRVHDLRHSHASYLIHSGISIVAVSRRLGHSDVNTTLSTYSHMMPQDEVQILEAIENQKEPHN